MTRTCGIVDCDRPHRARGLCSMHWKQQHGRAKTIDVVCPSCGQVTTKRDDGPATRRFCSLLCRDIWRVDQPDDPMHRLDHAPRLCRLPADHPVMEHLRTTASDAARTRALAQRSQLRAAIEDEQWDSIIVAIRARLVEVDGCWLWSGRVDANGYAEVKAGRRFYRVHRLMRAAIDRGWVSPDRVVHHTCAERLCVNPAHLQVVTHQDNVAEMLARRKYVERIAELEAALSEIRPDHPVLGRWQTA